MKLPKQLLGKRVKVSGHTHLGKVCEARYSGRGSRQKLVEARVRIDGKIIPVSPDQIERTTTK